jgi:hypothetical protein
MSDGFVPLLTEDDFWLDIGTGEALLVEGDESPPGGNGGRRGREGQPTRKLPLQPRRGLPAAYQPPAPPPPRAPAPPPSFGDVSFRKNVKATDLMLQLRDVKKGVDARFDAERQIARDKVANDVARKRAERTRQMLRGETDED